MNAASWWSAIGAAFGVVLTGAILAWLGRSRLRPAGENDERLRHPPGLLWIGLACFAFFGGLAVVSNVYANETTTWWTTLIFVGFTLLATLLIAEYCNVEHHLDDDGLHFRGLTGRRLYLRWSEIEQVSYGDLAKWFVLRARDGRVARISILLRGLPLFARKLLRHAPAGSIDSASRALLRKIERGRLPPLA